MIRNIFKIFIRIALILLLVVTIVLSIIQVPSVQTKLVNNYVLPELRKLYGTEFQVESVNITFFGNIELNGVSAIDHKQFEFIKIEQAVLNPDLFKIVVQDTINLDHIELYKPIVHVITYKGEDQNNFLLFFDKFSTKHPSGGQTIVNLSADLKEGVCSIVDQNLPFAERNILDAKNINLESSKLEIVDSDVFAIIEQLSAYGVNARGAVFDLKKLQTHFSLTDEKIALNQLILKTANSNLQGNIALIYNNMSEDFSQFLDKVTLDIYLEKFSQLGMKDVHYWVPSWSNFSQFQVSGKVKGTVSELNLKNIEIQSKNTQVRGNIKLKNIYDANQFSIQANNAFAQTSYTHLLEILPKNLHASIPTICNKLGVVTFNGNAYITPHLITSDQTTIQSSTLGKIKVNTLELTNYTTDKISYNTDAIATNFNLQPLIGSNTVGKITGHIQVKGSGIDSNTVNVTTNSTIQSIDIMGNTFRDILVKGSWANQGFKGDIISNDKRLPFEFNGEIQTAKSTYDADFKLHLSNTNLYLLGISLDPSARLTSDIFIQANAKSLDDLVGQIVLKNTHFKNDKQAIDFQDMVINSTINEKGYRVLSIHSEEIIEGYIQGDFLLSELLAVSRNAFGKLLPKYKPKPMKANQSLEFDLYLKDYLFQIFFPELVVKPKTYLKGKITPNNDLVLKTTTAGIKYDTYEIGPAEIHLNTENPFFQTSLKSDWLDVQGYHLDDLRLFTINNNDTIDLKAKFGGTIKNIKQDYALNLYYTKTPDRKDLIGFKRSSIQYNNQEWIINPFNESQSHYAIIDITKNEYFINKLRLESGEQKLELNGEYVKGYLGLNLDMQNAQLTSLIPKIDDFKPEGVANGKLQLEYGKDFFKPIADFTIDNFKINNIYVGDLTNSIVLQDGLYQVNSSIMRDGLKSLIVKGSINPDDSDNMFDINLKMNDFKLGILNAFLDGIFENIRGDVNGDVNLVGSINKPEYTGSITVANGGMKVSYLGVDYEIEGKPEILLATDLIHFYDQVHLINRKTNTKAKLSGLLEHHNFQEWYLKNITLTSDKVLVLDTNYSQNPLFYGKVFAQGLYATINGPAESLDINVIATTAPNSKLTINSGGSSLETDQKVEFINLNGQSNYVNLNNPNTLVSKLTGLNINLDAKITQQAELELILDEQTNHKMTVRGNGNISLEIDKAGEITMNGEVVLAKGTYNFALANSNFLQREFKIRPGSNIKWTGDIFNASLDVIAYYERSVSNIAEYLGSNYSQNIDTELEVDINGLLSEPLISFHIATPNAPETVKNQLQQKFLDSDQEKNQWFYILTLGQFLPETDKSNLVSYGLKSSLFDAASGIISGVVNNTFDFIKVNIKFVEGNPTYNTPDIIKTLLRVNTGSRFNIAGGVNIPTNISGNTTASQGIQTNYEGEISYNISEQNDGTLKVKAFTRPTSFGIENFNATQASTQATGVGIYYHEDFNSFKEFKSKLKNRFKSKSKRAKEELEQQRIDSLNQAVESGSSFLK